MKKTVLVICIILSVLLTFSVYGASDDTGTEAEKHTAAEDGTAARTILLWASGAHMESPYYGPVARRLNKMMEEEIPDSVNIIVLTGGTGEGWSEDLSLEGADSVRTDCNQEIIENGKVSGMTATDVQKILNLKHAWEFVLDPDIIQADSNYYMLCHIARLVNEGFFSEGGRIRGVPVTIGGSSYVPPIPVESIVREKIDDILGSDQSNIDKAVSLCLYSMKTQIFIDGNKRASVIYANHYLISHGEGFLVIPEEHVPEFKQLLVDYYEGDNDSIIRKFLKENCWRNF